MGGHYDSLLAKIHGQFYDIAPFRAIKWLNASLLNGSFNKS